MHAVCMRTLHSALIRPFTCLTKCERMQIKDSVIFGATHDALVLEPVDHLRGHPWALEIEGLTASSLGHEPSAIAAAPPAAALRVDTPFMPTGSVTHVRNRPDRFSPPC